MAAVAMLFTVIRGLTWPVFSIIYGKLFMVSRPSEQSAPCHRKKMHAIVSFR